MRAKISVIVPVFNSEQYIEECLLSVIEQTLSDIEIICVDDGSTDGTAAIISEYLKKDSRIRYVCIEHSGSGPARNTGIDESDSEFIAFMDSDDRYPEKNTLEKLYYHALENDVQICGGSWSESNGNKIITTFSDSEYTFKREGIVNYEDYQFDFGYHRFIYASDLIKKREIVFPNYLRYQDPPFFVLAMVSAGKFYSLCEPTYCRRVKESDPFDTADKIRDLISGFENVLGLADEFGFDNLREKTIGRITEHIQLITARVVLSEYSVAIPFFNLYSSTHLSESKKLPSIIILLLADQGIKNQTIREYIQLWKEGRVKLLPDVKTIYIVHRCIKEKGLKWFFTFCYRSLFKFIKGIRPL